MAETGRAGSESEVRLRGRISKMDGAYAHAAITSFSLLFLIPRTRSVRFLSNIRSKFPFTLRSAMVACKRKYYALATPHGGPPCASAVRLDSTGQFCDPISLQLNEIRNSQPAVPHSHFFDRLADEREKTRKRERATGGGRLSYSRNVKRAGKHERS